MPQHRERAILVAHRARPVAIPSPSHVEDPAPPLFGEQLARWRTIADALPARDGWELHPIRGKGITERHGPRPGRPSHRPAPTIRAHKDHRSFWLHPGTGVREPVAAAEGAALQGFPPSFKLVGSATAQGRQVGNAVPPPLAAAILASLVDGPR